MNFTIGHVKLDELEIFNGDTSLLVELMHNLHLLRVQELIAKAQQE